MTDHHRELVARLTADLAAALERMSKLDFERTAAELERDQARADLAAEKRVSLAFNYELRRLLRSQGWTKETIDKIVEKTRKAEGESDGQG